MLCYALLRCVLLTDCLIPCFLARSIGPIKQSEFQFQFQLTNIQDNILMQIRGEGLVDDDHTSVAAAATAAETEKVVYVLHPNCAVEEM